DFNRLFFEELPAHLDFRQGELHSQFELPLLMSQKIGNCTYASAEGIALMLLVLSQFYEHDASLEKLDVETAQRTALLQQLAFFQWQKHTLMQTLSKYLSWAKNPSNQFIPHIGLINRIFAARQNTPWIVPQLQEEWNDLRDNWERESQRLLANISLG